MTRVFLELVLVAFLIVSLCDMCIGASWFLLRRRARRRRLAALRRRSCNP
jgi:hypothetical protein